MFLCDVRSGLPGTTLSGFAPKCDPFFFLEHFRLEPHLWRVYFILPWLAGPWVLPWSKSRRERPRLCAPTVSPVVGLIQLRCFTSILVVIWAPFVGDSALVLYSSFFSFFSIGLAGGYCPPFSQT